MAKIDTDAMAQKTLETIAVLAKLPVVRVDREEFLKKQFKDSEYLDQILENGPQSVYTPESLRKKADKIITSSAISTSLTSFAAGLPSNPAVMVAAGGADVVQYFGFALNMAQQLAYLFGDDNLFSDDMDQLSEKTQIRIIAYLSAMLGVSGSATLVSSVSKMSSATIGKRVAAKALDENRLVSVAEKVVGCDRGENHQADCGTSGHQGCSGHWWCRLRRYHLCDFQTYGQTFRGHAGQTRQGRVDR